MNTNIADKLIAAGKELSQKVDSLKFAEPTTHIYNPLSYAWNAHEAYIRKHGNSPKKVLFMGMNPGPFGMAQTGIPFGQIEHVRDWIGVSCAVDKPKNEHPKRLIEGFNCTRSEVSGQRLWGFFKEQFASAEHFFESHYVLNYCPLVFYGGFREKSKHQINCQSLNRMSYIVYAINICSQWFRPCRLSG